MFLNVCKQTLGGNSLFVNMTLENLISFYCEINNNNNNNNNSNNNNNNNNNNNGNKLLTYLTCAYLKK